VKNRQMYKFCTETFLVALVYSLSILGIHLLITEIFNFTNQDSLIILIPVFLVSFPAIIYGYHIGFRRYYSNSTSSPHIPKESSITKTFPEILNGCINISLIIIPTFIGLYLIIIEKSYAFGVVVALLGAVFSIPVSKSLYVSLMQKSRNEKAKERSAH
jgi:hypothetical protein